MVPELPQSRVPSGRRRRFRPYVHTLIGEYVPTAKNALVAGLYSELGFAPLGAERYALELPAPGLPRTFVAVE